MTDYDDTNRGALFKNERRKTDKHPEYNGTINVEGREYWLSAWVNTAKSGKKYFALSVQPKDEQAGEESQATDIDDSEVPF